MVFNTYKTWKRHVFTVDSCWDMEYTDYIYANGFGYVYDSLHDNAEHMMTLR